MKKLLLIIASLVEALTGLVLVAYPPIVVNLLFGIDVAGLGIILCRIAGIALIGLSVACWPGNSARQQLYGMLTYGTLAMLYLLRIGIRGAPVGLLLWPAVALHAVLAALLVVAWWKSR